MVSNCKKKAFSKTFLILLSLMLSLMSTLSCSAQLPSSSNPLLQGLQCPVLKPIAQTFLLHHIEAKQFSLAYDARTIEQFIKRLDPSKIYLYQSDVQEIRGLLRGQFEKLGKDCTAIDKAHAILVKRLNEATEFVTKTLKDKKFKFNENISLTIDPAQRQFPANQKEAQDQLLKFIHFQLSNYLISDMKLPKAQEQLIHRYEINAKRQAKSTRDEIYSLYLDAFASSLDAHSSYLSKDTLEDFEIQMKLSLEGIGASLSWEDGYTTIEALIPGGSAERSGELQPKDKIIAVAQEDGPFEPVIDMPLRDVVKQIRGKKGKKVRLTILRQQGKKTDRKIVSLIRDRIKLEDEAAKLYFTERKVGNKSLKLGVIDLPSFYGDMTKKTRSCSEDVKALVEKAKTQKVDGLVFDLSRNSGGLLTEAVNIAGLFIRKGNVVATQNSSSAEDLDFLADQDEKIQYSGPLVVLTSRLSASASEIVAGALQDYKRAIIVGGDHTFGKGSVQAMTNLSAELGAIKVTTGMFFVPSGHSTQYRGVPGDIVLPSIYSTKDIGENSLDYSLKPKKVSSFLSDNINYPPNDKAVLAKAQPWSPVSTNIIDSLKKKSEERISKDTEFKKIKDELADLEKKKGVILLSESLKKQKEENKKQPNAKKAKTRKGRRGSDEEYLKGPHLNEALSILGDFILEHQKNAMAALPNS